MFQSTHPRRVWHRLTGNKSIIKSFNPHTHAGCDLYKGQRDLYDTLFQSTHPRRVWPRRDSPSWVRSAFQSTHPRRVWPTLNAVAVTDSMFQSTHPRRVWHQSEEIRYLVSGFNPHTHAGCDSRYLFNICWAWVSIHTPTQGVTTEQLVASIWGTFQSTHPRRVWLYI